MANCRICTTPLKAFMSFGKQPIANGFLLPDKFNDEYFFEMEVAVCDKCLMFQLIEQPAPNMMFHENYAFFSQTSKKMTEYFSHLAKFIENKYLTDDDAFIVELGSNDGVMLKNLTHKNHLGIEPSQNVADVASNCGVNTICDFFSDSLAQSIKQQYGNADVIFSANVMCHIPDLPSVAKGVQLLLKKDGVLIFEDPYLGDVLKRISFDQIYDEHVFLFSAHSVINAFKDYDLELINCQPVPNHGGSMRYTLGRKGEHKISSTVTDILDEEKRILINSPITYEKFKADCESTREKLLTLLSKIKEEGKSIVGYAATSKSTTLFNYCNIKSNLIDYICDTTPIKQGKFSPGVHIVVKPYEEFKNNPPDYALLLAWNHKDEIMAKEQEFNKNGGKWILFVDGVSIQ